MSVPENKRDTADPSQFAGTPEWKARVQAEAAGIVMGNISGANRFKENRENHSPGTGLGTVVNPFPDDKPEFDQG